MNKITGALHTATHRIPGIPEHDDATAARRHHGAERAHGLQHRGQQSPNADRHRNPPLVLVGWQTWIARLVGADHQ